MASSGDLEATLFPAIPLLWCRADEPSSSH